MRAVSIARYGDISVLEYREDIEIPKPESNQVLVEVKATSINPIDLMKREGYGRTFFEKQRSPNFPWILGSDVSGVIKEVGSKVRRYKTGQEVWGCTSGFKQGTYADYALLNQDEMSKKPKSIDFNEAAAIPYVALSTWSALIRWPGLRPKDFLDKKIFIQAGAGGVGTFAIQLLKHWGSKIATTCSSKNSKLLKSLGADITVDYNTEDFSEILSDYDIVLDSLGDLGGSESVIRSIGVLKKDSSSHYISLNHAFLRIIDEKGLIIGIPTALAKRQKIRKEHSPINIHWSLYRPNPSALEEVSKLIDEEKIKPIIDSIFTLEDTAKAQKKVAKSHAIGKVVIRVNQ